MKLRNERLLKGGGKVDVTLFGLVVESFGNGESFLDGARTLLKGERVGGDDGNEIGRICLMEMNFGRLGNGERTVH